MTAILKSIWRRRWVRVIAWTMATLVSLYVLTCAWWNWRGGRDWRDVQVSLERAGETLDFRKIAPEIVPDEKNFCAIPALKDIALAVDNDLDKSEPAAKRARLTAAGLPYQGGSRPRPAKSSALGRATDLKAWADWLRKVGAHPVPPDSGDAARDLLAALSRHDALIAELAAGLVRPEAQWTPLWRTRELPEPPFQICLPHYSATQEFVSMLGLQATAAARAGEMVKARESLLIALRMTRATLNDPLLISVIFAAIEAGKACDAIWEVCDARAGGSEDFRRLEEELARLDFGAGLLRACRGEMATCSGLVLWLKKTRDQKLIIFEGADWIMLNCSPGGWFDASAATKVRLEHDYFVKPLREGGLPGPLRGRVEFEKLVEQRKATFLFQLGSGHDFPPLSEWMNVAGMAAYAQCVVNQAMTACALERYCIGHGGYPASLEEVKLADGKPLPADIMTGKPMEYRKTADGRYVLWCVGFDGKDDGGRRVLDKKSPKWPENTRFSDPKYVGDWVWDFPAK